ncbi:hypothetical protein Tco_0036799, partial [Tanacetum coccineum]
SVSFDTTLILVNLTNAPPAMIAYFLATSLLPTPPSLPVSDQSPPQPPDSVMTAIPPTPLVQ